MKLTAQLATFSSLSPVYFVLLFVLVFFVLYFPTVITMLHLWAGATNPTYSHGLLLLAISVFLVYRQWTSHSCAFQLDGSARNFFPLTIGSVVWFLGDISYTQTLQLICLPFLILLLFWSLFGLRAAKLVAFPILVLILALPIWESLRPYLQHLTARLIVPLLTVAGIPSVREDIFILIPAGTFEVTGDCSGLRQFIVSTTITSLVAYLSQLRFLAGLIFVAMGMLVAVLTNALRICIVVIAGQLTNMQHYLVTGDHSTLGWVLFGIGMFIFLLLANRYIAFFPDTTADPEPHPPLDTRVLKNPAAPLAPIALRTTALALVGLAVGPALAHVYGGQDAPISASKLDFPEEIGSWRASGANAQSYRPRFHGADLEYNRMYEAADATSVYLYVAYYARQAQGKEAVYYLNRVYDDGRWKSIDTRTREFSRQLTVEETRIRSVEGQERIVWRWYYVNGSLTSNDYLAKTLNVLGTLQGDPSVAAIVIAVDINGNDEKARSLLRRFSIDALAELEQRIQDIQPR